jgi:hypothetical protein
MKLLTEQEWLNISKGELSSEADYRRAFSRLRNASESLFAQQLLRPALRKYRDANHGQFPADLSQLRSYFDPPIDDSILQRFEILPAAELPGLKLRDDWIVTQTAPIDLEHDFRYGVDSYGYTFTSFSQSYGPVQTETLSPILKAFIAANNGRMPANPSELLPYASTPETQAALQRLVKKFAVMSSDERASLQKSLQE